jgi:hypothetical protein
MPCVLSLSDNLNSSSAATRASLYRYGSALASSSVRRSPSFERSFARRRVRIGQGDTRWRPCWDSLGLARTDGIVSPSAIYRRIREPLWRMLCTGASGTGISRISSGLPEKLGRYARMGYDSTSMAGLQILTAILLAFCGETVYALGETQRLLFSLESTKTWREGAHAKV